MITKVMPLGASNTYGMYEDSTSPGGYRGPLQYMLQAQGASFDFVGLDRDGSIADADHNGYSGKPIDWFLNPVDEGIWDRTGTYSHWINSGAKPAIHYFIEQAGLQSSDVILLLAGTNDVRLGDSAETMLSEMDQLLRLIVTHDASPEVHIMKLQPIGGDWWEDNDPTRTNNDTIRIFNEGLEKLVSGTYADLGVTLVDDKATAADLSTDGVHLTEAGNRDTALAWYDSLMARDTFDFDAIRPVLVASTARESVTPKTEIIGGKKIDRLPGTEGADKLDGREGADTMTGRGGDDTYVVDNRRDVVTEVAGGGVDTVQTNLTTYALGDHVENLTFTGAGSGTLTGNALGNILRGGAGADLLDGGAGADVYWGGAGTDTFVLRKSEAAGDCVNLEAGDRLQLEGFGRGAVLVENRSPLPGTTTDAAGDWCISYNGGVEVIKINGFSNLTEGADFFFV